MTAVRAMTVIVKIITTAVTVRLLFVPGVDVNVTPCPPTVP